MNQQTEIRKGAVVSLVEKRETKVLNNFFFNFQLNNGYVDSKKRIEVPQIGDAVISYFEEAPYRAEIIAMDIDNKSKPYRVRYVDYGNESLCSKEELFMLDRDEQPDVNLLHLVFSYPAIEF